MIDWLSHLTRRAKPRFFPADQRQAEQIATLHGQSFRRGWSEEEVGALLADPAVVADCAAARGRVLAFILSRKAADEAEILSVAVDKNGRGCGLGGEILGLHLRRLVGMGIRAVFLEVDEANHAAIRLYRRAGFRQVGHRPNYYPQPGAKSAAALVLRRDLL